MSHSVYDSTLRVRSTRSLFQTRISAHHVRTAFLVRLAILVPVARVPHAFRVRLTLEPVWAHAHGPVIDRATFGILSAPRAVVFARISAFLVVTRTVRGTIRVRATSDQAHCRGARTYMAL